MKNIKYYQNAALFLIVLVLTSSSVASLAIRNYDNDPDLAAAFEYDRGMTTDRSKADRELAEKYYLKYLKKDIPSFQKARVYLRLGSMFTVGSDPRKGIMPDREKGDRYLEKVLQLEPERIDPVTMRARTLSSISPKLSREENLKNILDVYEWLCSLTEEKCMRLWLPLEPEQQTILHITLKQLKNFVPNTRHTTAVNTLDIVIMMPDQEARLKEIIERFPGKKIAHMAWHLQQFQSREVRQKVMRILAEYSPRHALTPEGDTTPVNLESQAGGMREEESIPPEKSFTQRSNDVSVLADIPPIEDGTNTVWIVYPLIICAALVGSLVLYVAWRRKHPERNRES